jgi:hypothetical protein
MDAIYDAMTSAARDFESDPLASKLFREGAADLTREFQTYVGQNLLILVRKPDPFSSSTLEITFFSGSEAEAKVSPAGKIELKSAQARCRNLPGWNDPKSEIRLRFEHLVKGLDAR